MPAKEKEKKKKKKRAKVRYRPNKKYTTLGNVVCSFGNSQFDKPVGMH